MKTRQGMILWLAVGMLFACSNDKYKTIPPEQAKDMGKKAIMALGSTLLQEVSQALANDTTGVGAIQYCNIHALPLTDSINASLGDTIRVRRTALRVRNPKNTPDDIDIQVMQELQRSQTHDLYFYDDPNLAEYRVYKPLYIMSLCLKCHGPVDNIHPAVRQVLKEKYPQDRAVNFELGDFRGVIVAEIPKKVPVK